MEVESQGIRALRSASPSQLEAERGSRPTTPPAGQDRRRFFPEACPRVVDRRVVQQRGSFDENPLHARDLRACGAIRRSHSLGSLARRGVAVRGTSPRLLGVSSAGDRGGHRHLQSRSRGLRGEGSRLDARRDPGHPSAAAFLDRGRDRPPAVRSGAGWADRDDALGRAAPEARVSRGRRAAARGRPVLDRLQSPRHQQPLPGCRAAAPRNSPGC